MGSILVVGNILKDVYLRLDENQNNFEYDEKGDAWLDLAFRGDSYSFFRRTSTYGGAAVSLEVLTKFGLQASISGSKASLQNGQLQTTAVADYRYILCCGDQINYLTPSKRSDSKWEAPGQPVDWVLVDRSAVLTEELVQQLLSFISLGRETKLAIFVHKEAKKWERELTEVADLIFAEAGAEVEGGAKVCRIDDHNISFAGNHAVWQTARQKMLTGSTTGAIIAASLLGALVRGKTETEAVILAKLNVENASLAGSLEWDKLQELLAKYQKEQQNLKLIAKSLLAPGKGILAADESGGSIHKKFAKLQITDDAEQRRNYRNIFFATANLADYVSGVILFDETTQQLADNGQNFVDFLTGQGIIPGIKVDQGLAKLPHSNETWTRGLEGLAERLANYYAMGLRFAKWRAAFKIGEASPSRRAIAKNCESLASYAHLCQDAGLVPIVEPEVVYDGDYSIEQCAKVTAEIWERLFKELAQKSVHLEACILKCNMILAGKRYALQSSPTEVGKATAELLKTHLPDKLAGVVFLSGGQTAEQATRNLQAILQQSPFPWPVTFSFARALQEPALDVWRGDQAKCTEARAAFLERLQANVAVLRSGTKGN